MSELPEGWAHACISDLADINPKQNFDDHLPAGFVPMSHAPTNFRDKLRFDERNWGEIKKAYTNFKDGDVIFAKVTPCFENGKAALVEGLPNGIGAGSSEFFVLRPSSEGVSAKYLLALVKSREFMLEGAANMTGAVGLRRVPRQFVEGFALPVPPAAEQTRIAQKLDELLAQVDTLKARMDGIPALLKRFRQSVLTAAVSGRLTEEWRDINQHAHDAAEAALGRFAVIEHDEKYHAPSEWVWLRIGQASKLINGDRGKNYPSKSELVESGVPFINAGHIDEGCRLSSSKMNYISRAKFESLASGKISPGDILFCLRGTVGKVSPVEPYTEGAIASSLVIVRPLTDLNGRFTLIYLRSPQCSEKIQLYDNGTAQPNLSAASLAAFPIAVPSKVEQKEIVRRVEQLFAFADQFESKVKNAKARIDHLTQSILAKAFRGELVPQDPNDEPASVLLERIKAQRAAAPKARRGRKASA